MTETMTIEVMPPEGGGTRNSGTFAAMGLLVRRRLIRDRWLVLSSALIVGLATVLSLSGPELVARTIDEGAADAVAGAGPAADIIIEVPIGNPHGDNVSSVRGLPTSVFAGLGETIIGNLPQHTASVVDGHEAWILSRANRIAWAATADAVAEQAENPQSELEQVERIGDVIQFGHAPGADVTLVEGELPEAPPRPEDISGVGAVIPPTQIAISREVADTLELGIGDRLLLSTPAESMELEVSGIVAAADPSAEVWQRYPEFVNPVVIDGGPNPDVRRGTVMVSAETLEGITRSLRAPVPGTVKITVDPRKMNLALTSEVARELRELPTDAKPLVGEDAGVNVDVSTGLDEALSEYPARARAALAQMSVIIAGVVSVAAVVIALMAALVLTRRDSDIALERARGSSVASTALRLLFESLLVTALGLALGIGAANVITPGVSTSSGLLRVVAIVSALSAPVLGALKARRMWTGRREAANRQDRAKVAKARGARRLTLEALTIVVAAAAVVSLRGRSVLQTTTEGIDPFLAAAPVLIALAVVVIVVRLYPLPMAVIQFFAKRTKGVAGVITLAKSRERIPVLPLLALTLAIGIAVSGGLLVSTVKQGQDLASWERVGADVRIESEVTAEAAERLESKGLTVSRGYAKVNAIITLGPDYSDTFLFAMDSSYPQILRQAGVEDVSSLEKLYAAAEAAGPRDPLPALATQEVIDIAVHSDSRVYVGRTYLPFEITGIADIVPEGFTDEATYLIMPAEQLLGSEVQDPVAPNIAFVSGPGAAAAVAAEASIDQSTVITREDWMAAMQESALIGGVQRAIGIAVLAVGALAAVALLVTILRGVRERGRALSMLRTQGMGSGYGWWLSLAELAPLTIAAVVGGAGAGLSIMWLLGETLGLKLLSGGLTEPPLAPDWTFMAILGAGIVLLLFVAVAAEVLVHRRNKLSEVLRWGESR